MQVKKTLSLIIISLLVINMSTKAQKLERKDVADKYKWNLADLYKNKSDWQAAKDKLAKEIDDMLQYRGKLAESPDMLYNACAKYFGLLKQYYQVADYAARIKDEDLRNTENAALSQQADNLGTDFSEKTAYLSPEILKIDPEKIKQFFEEKKELGEYKFFIEDIQRRRAHTLSEDGEKLLAGFGTVTGTPSNVYNIFTNAEMPYPTIKLSDGKEIELTAAVFGKSRMLPNRQDRMKVFESFFDNYKKFQNTLGENYAGKLRADYTYAKDRNYGTALESALDNANIPVSVYENLITQINKSLPTLHRFLTLKKEMLGLDTLHYYDLYTPIVKQVDEKFTIEEGQKVILDALKPLGPEYLSTLQKAFNNRWVDYYPTVGKRSGAYSSGAAYDVHPYILMNWTDDYNSVSTLAHELGHTMHSYFSNTNQPFPTADYPIFVAEIASTCNETLLNNYMVEHAKTDEEKISLLGNYLELLRTTIFRQTLFAEFELQVHKKIEKGEPITGDLS